MVSVMLYPCIFCIALLMDLFVLYCSVRLVCCVFDSIYELFGETIRNMFACGFYFVVKCYGSVCVGALLDRQCMVFQRLCGSCL